MEAAESKRALDEWNREHSARVRRVRDSAGVTYVNPTQACGNRTQACVNRTQALHRHCRVVVDAAASMSVPFVFAAATHPTADDCLGLSAALHPLLSVHVVRRASLAQV